MKLYPFFKSVIDEDRAAVVLCDLEHKIIYMNPAAVQNYQKYGGEKLVGESLLDCHNENSVNRIKEVLDWFQKDKRHNRVHTSYDTKHARDIYMIALRDENGDCIGYYEKHAYRTKDDMPFYDML